jgi:ribonuclease P protein component
VSKSTTPGTPKPDRLRFRQTSRIRLSREFALVRKEGRSVQGRLLRLSVVAEPGGGATRFGFITSKRVGDAVARNRVRRRLREICRLERPEISPGWLVVTVAKSSAAKAAYADLREEWLLLARRLSIFPRS